MIYLSALVKNRGERDGLVTSFLEYPLIGYLVSCRIILFLKTGKVEPDYRSKINNLTRELNKHYIIIDYDVWSGVYKKIEIN